MFAIFRSVKYCLVEPWTNNMIMNCFHAYFFAQTEAVGSWKRHWEPFKGGRQKRFRIPGHLSGCRNPLIQKESETFLLKLVPVTRPLPPTTNIPLLCLSLGELSKQSEAETGRQQKLPSPPSRGRSFLCVELGPRSDTLALLPDVKLSQLLPQQNNKTTPCFCLSLACRHQQPGLHWFGFVYVYLTCLFYWITWWGSKSRLIMAFYPYANWNKCR